MQCSDSGLSPFPRGLPGQCSPASNAVDLNEQKNQGTLQYVLYAQQQQSVKRDTSQVARQLIIRTTTF